MALGDFQAASSFLHTVQLLEPEMVMQLMSTKIAWTESRTKSNSTPRPENQPSAVYTKNLKRSKEDAKLTFLDWLRAYDHEKTTPKRYKAGNTLVALKCVSIFNPVFFYQCVARNFAHDEEKTLHHAKTVVSSVLLSALSLGKIDIIRIYLIL